MSKIGSPNTGYGSPDGPATNAHRRSDRDQDGASTPGLAAAAVHDTGPETMTSGPKVSFCEKQPMGPYGRIAMSCADVSGVVGQATLVGTSTGLAPSVAGAQPAGISVDPTAGIR